MRIQLQGSVSERAPFSVPFPRRHSRNGSFPSRSPHYDLCRSIQATFTTCTLYLTSWNCSQAFIQVTQTEHFLVGISHAFRHSFLLFKLSSSNIPGNHQGIFYAFSYIYSVTLWRRLVPVGFFTVTHYRLFPNFPHRPSRMCWRCFQATPVLIFLFWPRLINPLTSVPQLSTDSQSFPGNSLFCY